ncbi:UNVERIFIED_CONTAM: hypothetical protein ACS92_07320 [Bacillus cereus]
MQRHVAQHGALTSGRHAVRVDVVECFSEARDILTHVAEKRHVVCGEVVGVVVCEPRPRAVGLAVGVVVGDIVSEFLQIYWASDVHRDLVVERRDRTFKTGRLVCVDLARARVVRARVDALHVVEIALEPKVLELQHSVLIRVDSRRRHRRRRGRRGLLRLLGVVIVVVVVVIIIVVVSVVGQSRGQQC